MRWQNRCCVSDAYLRSSACGAAAAVNPQVVMLLMVVYFSMAFLWAAGTFTWGTATRHHMIHQWIVLMLGVPALLEMRSRVGRLILCGTRRSSERLGSRRDRSATAPRRPERPWRNLFAAPPGERGGSHEFFRSGRWPASADRGLRTGPKAGKNEFCTSRRRWAPAAPNACC